MVKNTSDKYIVVSYEIEPIERGFALFNTIATMYNLNNRNNIDWNKEITVTDNDTSSCVININIPPKSALIFGRLSNDVYKSHNQKFINDRHFNFIKMEIKKLDETTIITKNDFDNFFIKKGVEITYEI